MLTYDFAIRGATIFDGSGNEPFEGDVAVVGRTIVAVGDAPGEAGEEIDGRGLVLTPGFVDIHTHYDAQVTWDSHLLPSSTHGVTSVVMGNCAIGIAPCKPEDRTILQRVIAGVEDLPEPVLAEGVPWTWETFPEYMTFLRGRQTDVDFAAQVPHSAVRVYVMGKRGADRESARSHDLAEMRKIVREGMEAGAIGVSTSHTIVHRTVDGVLAPSETAAEDELHALAAGLKDFGDGVFQLICDFNDVTREDGSVSFDMMKRIAQSCGRPLSYTLLQHPDDDDGWEVLLDLVAKANAEGVKITSQVAPRGTGLMFGLDLSLNPFTFCASYQAIADLPLEDRVARMRDPQLRQQILSETPAGDNWSSLYMTTLVESMFELGDPPNYEPAAETFLGPRAEAMGVDPRALAYDLILKNDGHNMLYLALVNYAGRNFDVVHKMMMHPNSVVALGDGGAHLGYICDAGYTTFMLTYWAKERSRDRLSLPWIVQALTSRPAETVGLLDRGRIAPGYKADLNLIDMDRLRVHAPRVAYDLPAKGRRLHQDADGYRLTMVGGQITYRDGKSTGALPGRLIEGPQGAPSATSGIFANE